MRDDGRNMPYSSTWRIHVNHHLVRDGTSGYGLRMCLLNCFVYGWNYLGISDNDGVIMDYHGSSWVIALATSALTDTHPRARHRQPSHQRG